MPGNPQRRSRGPVGSGVKNGEWEPQFPGQRPPFQPGHQLSLKHGAYSVLAIQPRAEEIAERLRETVVEAERFEAAIQSAAMIGARVEAAIAALSQLASPAEMRRLDSDCRGWVRLWLHALGSLGLTPASYARIMRDTGIGRAAAQQVAYRDLVEHVEREYASIGTVDDPDDPG